MRAFKNVLFIFVLSLFLPANVFAQKVAGPIQDWGSDNAVRLCKYGSGAPTVEVVYNVTTNQYGIYFKQHDKDNWQNLIKGSFNGVFNYKATNGQGIGAFQDYKVGWLEKGETYPKKDFTSYYKENGFDRCPDYAYLSKKDAIVYFSNDSNSKSKFFMIAKNNAKKDEYKDKFDLVRNYLNSLSDEQIKKISANSVTPSNSFIDSALTGISTRLPNSSAASAFAANVRNKYFLGAKHSNGQLPAGIMSIINEWVEKEENNAKIKSSFSEEVEQQHENGTITDENYQNYVQNTEQIWNNNTLNVSEHPISKDTSYGNNVKDPTTDINCSSILTKDLTILVKNVVNFVRFLGPLLVIVFTIIEFAGAIFSADVSITKPLGRLIRRLIAAALLFFLPFIIFPLFDFLHITMAKECFSILN